MRRTCRVACAVLLAAVSPTPAEGQESPIDRGVWLVAGTGRINGTHDLEDETVEPPDAPAAFPVA